MALSVTETEQVLHTVHETLIAIIYDDMSGIPGIRKTLAEHGLKLNIQIEVGVDSTTQGGERELSDLALSTSLRTVSTSGETRAFDWTIFGKLPRLRLEGAKKWKRNCSIGFER